MHSSEKTADRKIRRGSNESRNIPLHPDFGACAPQRALVFGQLAVNCFLTSMAIITKWQAHRDDSKPPKRQTSRILAHIIITTWTQPDKDEKGRRAIIWYMCIWKRMRETSEIKNTMASKQASKLLGPLEFTNGAWVYEWMNGQGNAWALTLGITPALQKNSWSMTRDFRRRVLYRWNLSYFN